MAEETSQAHPSNPNGVAAQKPSQTPSLITFPSKEMPHSIMLVFKKYKYTTVEEGYPLLRTNAERGQRSKSSGVDIKDSKAIQLPFPTQLVDNTSLRVGGFERDPMSEQLASLGADMLNGMGNKTLRQGLQALGSSAAQGLGSLGSAAGEMSPMDMLKGAGNFGAGIVNAALDTPASEITRAAAYLIRSKLPGTISKSVDLALKSTINPRETLAFEGVNLKNHSFSWDLYPENKNDSQVIKHIVSTIKRNALPGVQDTVGVAKAFLEYPSTVDMYLLGVNTDHFIKFKTCMISDFNVDYGGGGLVTLIKGGVPAKVTISLTMTELEIHTSDDYPEDLPAETVEAVDPNITGGIS